MARAKFDPGEPVRKEEQDYAGPGLLRELQRIVRRTTRFEPGAAPVCDGARQRLLVAQGGHGIDAGGPVRRNKASHKRDKAQQDSDG